MAYVPPTSRQGCVRSASCSAPWLCVTASTTPRLSSMPWLLLRRLRRHDGHGRLRHRRCRRHHTVLNARAPSIASARPPAAPCDRERVHARSPDRRAIAERAALAPPVSFRTSTGVLMPQAAALNIAPKSNPQLHPSRFALAEHKCNLYFVTPADGTTLEQVLEPVYWSHVASALAPDRPRRGARRGRQLVRRALRARRRPPACDAGAAARVRVRRGRTAGRGRRSRGALEGPASPLGRGAALRRPAGEDRMRVARGGADVARRQRENAEGLSHGRPSRLLQRGARRARRAQARELVREPRAAPRARRLLGRRGRVLPAARLLEARQAHHADRARRRASSRRSVRATRSRNPRTSFASISCPTTKA